LVAFFQHEKWFKFNHMEATIMEALVMLNDLVDESDPDTALPNIVHAFQTAERIREEHPDKEWFHLVGLIHDLGKESEMSDKQSGWAYISTPILCRSSPFTTSLSGRW
jgi:inositol oxygenase